MCESSHPPLIAGLLRPEAYPHTVDRLRVRETHISWVLLTGDFAYKIKKPVNLGFADFSTLDRRRFCCEEEVRLNRRFAADLYLNIVPITRTAVGLHVGGQGEPVEYAVQMRQFDERDLLSRLLAAGKLERRRIDELASAVASVHKHADRADERGEWGSALQVGQPAADNIETIRPLLEDPSRSRQLDKLAHWTQHAHQRLTAAFSSRLREGFVRECHGDLHLGNVVLWKNRVTPFDCIEFNPALRWIDVMSEVAFVVMDLNDHARPDLAGRFLNAYLEHTGDYFGLTVLPFYLVYRALVRAKVAGLRLQQPGLTARERRQLVLECHGYLDLALRNTAPRPLSLTITHGLSGSGKTTGTTALIEQQGAIRLRSDVERKRLFGVDTLHHAAVAVDAGIYSPAATSQTYERLAALTHDVIHAGFPVIVDATFLKRAQRSIFRQLADELGVPFHILAFEVDEQVLRERVRQRSAAGLDASDATPAVLNRQIESHEPFTAEERLCVIDGSGPDLVP
ncbi:MAG: AAA family ATPase [Planctomycetaceae bacterium]